MLDDWKKSLEKEIADAEEVEAEAGAKDPQWGMVMDLRRCIGRINTLFPFQQEKKEGHVAVQHRGGRLAY